MELEPNTRLFIVAGKNVDVSSSFKDWKLVRHGLCSAELFSAMSIWPGSWLLIQTAAYRIFG